MLLDSRQSLVPKGSKGKSQFQLGLRFQNRQEKMRNLESRKPDKEASPRRW
jgi:hypothetical protein